MVHVYKAQMQQLLGFNKAPVIKHTTYILERLGKANLHQEPATIVAASTPQEINSRMTEGIYTCFASVCGTKAIGREKATSP